MAPVSVSDPFLFMGSAVGGAILLTSQMALNVEAMIARTATRQSICMVPFILGSFVAVGLEYIANEGLQLTECDVGCDDDTATKRAGKM